MIFRNSITCPEYARNVLYYGERVNRAGFKTREPFIEMESRLFWQEVFPKARDKPVSI